jgi:hypothetical protein
VLSGPFLDPPIKSGDVEGGVQSLVEQRFRDLCIKVWIKSGASSGDEGIIGMSRTSRDVTGANKS